MSELITVRIQIGVSDPKRFSNSVPWHFTVDDFRQHLRLDQRIDPSFGIVLIYNGGKLSEPGVTLYDLGICNDSLIICIISKNTGREIEALFGNKKENKDEDLKIVCDVEFYTRPFGFAVWANEHGENAIVTQVSRRSTIHRGLKIGYCIYKVNDTDVLGMRHKQVLNLLKKTEFPVRLQFVDRGIEETIIFQKKPLCFTVIQDKEMTNARVSKTEESAAKKGVKIGSHIVAVNDEPVFGRNHIDIILLINKATFPMRIVFRMPPKLKSMSIKNRLTGRNQGNLTKIMKKKFAWGLR